MASDMVSAGVSPEQPKPMTPAQGQLDTNPESILRALSQGPMAQAAQNPMMSFAAGLSGANAGWNNTINPVVAQVAQQEDTYRRSQLAQFEIMNTIAARRQHQEDMQLALGRDLLKSNSPVGRQMGAQIVGKRVQAAGIQMPPGWEQSLAAEDLSLDKRKQVYTAVLANPSVSDDYLIKTFGLVKDQIPQMRLEATSEPVHKILFGKSPLEDQIALLRANLDQKKYEAVISGQELTRLKIEQQGELANRRENRLDEAAAQRQKEFEARIALAERNTAAKELQVQTAIKALEYKMATGPEEKRKAALDQATLLVDQMEAYAQDLNDKKYLPQAGAGTFSQSNAQALANRKLFPNDPAWQTWVKHLQGSMIGYARSVQNDIGPRAMAAFQGAAAMADNPPDIASIRQVAKEMRTAIQLGYDGKDTARYIYFQHPDGAIEKTPWRRGMVYPELPIRKIE